MSRVETATIITGASSLSSNPDWRVAVECRDRIGADFFSTVARQKCRAETIGAVAATAGPLKLNSLYATCRPH